MAKQAEVIDRPFRVECFSGVSEQWLEWGRYPTLEAAKRAWADAAKASPRGYGVRIVQETVIEWPG